MADGLDALVGNQQGKTDLVILGVVAAEHALELLSGLE